MIYSLFYVISLLLFKRIFTFTFICEIARIFLFQYNLEKFWHQVKVRWSCSFLCFDIIHVRLELFVPRITWFGKIHL